MIKVIDNGGFPRCYFRDIQDRTCSISDADGDGWFKYVQKKHLSNYC